MQIFANCMPAYSYLAQSRRFSESRFKHAVANPTVICQIKAHLSLGDVTPCSPAWIQPRAEAMMRFIPSWQLTHPYSGPDLSCCWAVGERWNAPADHPTESFKSVLCTSSYSYDSLFVPRRSPYPLISMGAAVFGVYEFSLFIGPKITE